MKKSTPPAHFSNVLDDENPTPAPATGRAAQLNIPVDAETKKRLDRAVFWKGKTVANQKSYLVQLLKDALARDPDADKLMPGE